MNESGKNLIKRLTTMGAKRIICGACILLKYATANDEESWKTIYSYWCYIIRNFPYNYPYIF